MSDTNEKGVLTPEALQGLISDGQGIQQSSNVRLMEVSVLPFGKMGIGYNITQNEFDPALDRDKALILFARALLLEDLPVLNHRTFYRGEKDKERE